MEKLAITHHALSIVISILGLVILIGSSPSIPDFPVLLTISAIPFILLVDPWRAYRNKIARMAILSQAILIMGFSGWVLAIKAGLLPVSS